MSSFLFIFHFPSVYTRHFIYHPFAINLLCTNPIFNIYLQLVITKGYGLRAATIEGSLSLRSAGRREPWERGWGLVSAYYLPNIFFSPTELPTCPTTKGSINSPRAALTIITLVTGAETQTHFFYILFLVNFFNHFRCRILRDKRKLH